ncbi:hypothetical protein NMG60_11022268 [Bertholletia excelsa]
MAMSPTVELFLGSVAFAIFWVLAVFPAVPFLPIGRTAGSLLGAVLMVIFQVITPEEAYNSIDLSILGLLFGTMVVSIYLEKADMFKYLGKLLSWRSLGAKDLLCRICVVSAISSAFFTNDTSCVLLTEFVLKIARQQNIPPHPFLLALASSANIGSSATPIGNPQNLVIAIESGISFLDFVSGILPAMLVGVIVNSLILLCMYRKLLSVDNYGEEEASREVISHQLSPATMSHANTSEEWTSLLEPVDDHSHGYASESNTNGHGAHSTSGVAETILTVQSPEQTEAYLGLGWIRLVWKTCVYLVTIGMLAALLLGFNMSWTAITAALALVVIDFKDARPSLDKVSYSLLVFFCGMFISVAGFDTTGIPGTLWKLIEPYAQVDRTMGLALLAAVILILSNLISNVPAVLLLGARVAASAGAISPENEKKAWLILAWVSTVAGNLSLLGSAANLIVCEQARRAPHLGYNLSFWSHLKFGVPSTIIVTAIGLVLIRT